MSSLVWLKLPSMELMMPIHGSSRSNARETCVVDGIWKFGVVVVVERNARLVGAAAGHRVVGESKTALGDRPQGRGVAVAGRERRAGRGGEARIEPRFVREFRHVVADAVGQRQPIGCLP